MKQLDSLRRSPFLRLFLTLGLITTWAAVARADVQPSVDQVCETFTSCPGWTEDEADPCPGVVPTTAVQYAQGLPLNSLLLDEPAYDDFASSPYATILDPITDGEATKIPVVITWRSPGAADPGWKVLYTAASSPSFDASTPKQTTCDVIDDDKHNESANSVTSDAIQHAVRLKLDPDTRYYYRAVSCASGKFMDGTLKTPPLAGTVPQTVRFAHFGEIHAGNSTSPQIVDFREEVRGFNPDFIVESGDMINSVELANFEKYLTYSQHWLPTTFLLPAYSHHWPYAVSAQLWRKEIKLRDFFVLPNRRNQTAAEVALSGQPTPPCEQIHRPWYRTRYGALEVYTLAVPSSAKLTQTDIAEQNDWLACTLQGKQFDSAGGAAPTCSGTPENDDPPFRIVAFHEPYYGADSSHKEFYDDSNIHPFIHTLRENGGVDLVLVSHAFANEMSHYFVPETTTAADRPVQIETSMHNTLGSGSAKPEVEVCTLVGSEKAKHFLEVEVEVDSATHATLDARYRDNAGAPICCLHIERWKSQATWKASGGNPPSTSCWKINKDCDDDEVFEASSPSCP